ncbi:MAG: hypothetical protein VXV96_15075 [Bdellovibrionota bacterium]|nr:hypothetical protein [Bdellovibrionota bacterium]
MFLSNSIQAEVYKWNDLTIDLPFPKKWLSKKPRTKDRDPLMFLDIEAGSPRIIGRVYHPEVLPTPSNLSVFKGDLLKSKNRWMKENKATLEQSLSSSYNKETNAFTYEYMFSNTYGKFLEIATFAACKKPIAVKLLIPHDKLKRAQSLGLLKPLREHQICAKIR